MVIGYMRSDYCFEVCHFERFAATEDPLHVVDELPSSCGQFRASLDCRRAAGTDMCLTASFWI